MDIGSNNYCGLYSRQVSTAMQKKKTSPSTVCSIPNLINDVLEPVVDIHKTCVCLYVFVLWIHRTPILYSALSDITRDCQSSCERLIRQWCCVWLTAFGKRYSGAEKYDARKLTYIYFNYTQRGIKTIVIRKNLQTIRRANTT